MTLETLFDSTDSAGVVVAPAAPEAQARRPRPPRAPNPKRDSKDHGRKLVRGYGIRAFVGPNGSGKSAAAIFYLLPTLDGIQWKCDEPSHRHMRPDYVDPLTGDVGPVTTGLRRVLSTVPILDSETGLPHRLYDELSSKAGGWTLVLEAEHCDILFDEVTGIAGSREAMGLPVAVQTHLQQLRKPDCTVSWTAPSYKRADAIIRECTKLVVVCRGYLPDYRGVRHKEEQRAWVPNRLFKWRAFDGEDFAEFNASMALGDRKQGSKLNALRPKKVAWVWGPGSKFFASYDSWGAVSRVAEYLDGGRCAHCGGKRSVPVCKCDH